MRLKWLGRRNIYCDRDGDTMVMGCNIDGESTVMVNGIETGRDEGG